jgi:tRNA pseudouridine38-40 synthase
MPNTWDAASLLNSLNSILPGDVWIETVRETTAQFHPRYDALRRTYRYEVGLRSEACSPFHMRWCWPLADALDRNLLTAAATMIVGRHSFLKFSKTGQPERGYECHIMVAAWDDTPLGMQFTVTADRYLHHMVRYLVGTMVDIGRARRPPRDMASLLADHGNLTTSPPAPAQGLYLAQVEYSDET